MWFLLVVTLVVALAALAVAVLAWRTAQARPLVGDADALPEDVVGLRQEVAALQQATRGALRHLAVVRYDAFGDVGGHLSWSVALLDDAGDGMVMTSIHGRSDARTYAKTVTGWTTDAQLSPEELEAISNARP